MTETTAVAMLPGIEIEIRHREIPGEAEMISVAIKATPGFAAIGQQLERGLPLLNPFQFWLEYGRAARAFWAPWLVTPRISRTPD